MNSVLDASRCPLCGEANHCVMARCGEPNQPCWCRAEQFPQALLERVPVAARQQACICLACVRAHHAADAPSA